MGLEGLRLRLHAGSLRLTLLDPWSEKRAGEEVLPPTHAAFVLDQLLDDAGLRRDLARALRGWDPTTRIDSLEKQLRERLRRGELMLVQEPIRHTAVPIDEAPPEDVPLGPSEDPEDLEFDVVYPDSSPVKGLAYVLTDPGGSPTKGKLPDDGVVTKKRADGTYSLSIVDIDVLVWSKPSVRAKKDVTLSARVSGIDDGAQGKVQIFPLYDEDPKSAVATLSVTVQDKKAETTWQYVPKSNAETGTASFVAELSFEGGKVWRKTQQLDVELPQVKSVTWSVPAVASGEDVELAIDAPGFDDGAEVKVTLMRLRQAGDESVGDLDPLALAGGAASAPLHCGDAKLPAKSGDVYAKVTVKKDGVERSGTSPLLWVSAEAAESDADEDSDADAAE
jgi:hypothetical protein